MGIRKLTKKVIVKVERRVFGDQGALGLNLGSAGERSPVKFKALVFRVSCKDNGVRKKKRKTSKVLYKFVSGIKKYNH